MGHSVVVHTSIVHKMKRITALNPLLLVVELKRHLCCVLTAMILWTNQQINLLGLSLPVHVSVVPR